MSFSSTWPKLTLKSAGVSLIDCDHRTPTAAEEGYPYIAIPQLKNGHISLEGVRRISREDYLDWTKKLKPQANDVIVVRRCNSGDSAHVPPGLECAIGQNLIILRADGEIILPEFLRWLINGPDWWDQVSKYINVGAVFDSLRCRDIPNFELTIPPVEHQREISTVLGALDDRISLLRETNTTLEAIAQALFKSWFVDFDPVRAKQEGREPEGMDADTAALFPVSFEESELGLVPKGWRVNSIGEISEILNGFAFKSEDYTVEDSGVFVLRTTNFSDDGFATRLDKDVFLPTSFLKSHEKFICEPFDFHLVMVGASVGRSSTLLPHMLPALRNQNMWCFRERAGFPSKFFIHEIVKLITIEALRSTSGSAREFLRKGDFQLKKLILPPGELISHFDDRVGALKHKIAVNEHQSDTLMKIRDTLLPRLISGQLRLPDAETLSKQVFND